MARAAGEAGSPPSPYCGQRSSYTSPKSGESGRRESSRGAPVAAAVRDPGGMWECCTVAKPDREGIMAFARVVAFDGVTKQRIEDLRREIGEQGRPDEIPATEI